MSKPTKNPYLIDSHCHLHDPEFFTPAQQTNFLTHAAENNVRQIICIGTSDADSLLAQSFAESHENVFWTYGIHPESASEAPAACQPHSDKLVAIGEIGLDYHYEGYDRAAQIRLLEQMLDLAVKLDLPCSFHVRDALPDFFAVFANFSTLKPSVLHSFTDSRDNLDRALSLGLTLGLNGIATFANLPCYREIPPTLLNHIVLETDAPFLTPEPKRGIINKPGNIKQIAAWLSLKSGVSEAKIAEITTQNAKRIFNLPDPRS